jgi:hypothetical protein
MNSLHGLVALMRPEFLTGFQRLIVVSYWSPGSPHTCAADEISRIRSRAGNVSMILPLVTPRVCHVPPETLAFMNASETRTEWLAFWYWIES